MAKSHMVVLIHGIRTQAEWAEMVAQTLSEIGAICQPVRYGFFDLFRFIFPFWTRRGPIKRVLRELYDIQANNRDADISIVAHSFGTYALMKCLEQPGLSLHRIILCGSIVSNDFRRALLRAKLSDDPILNDCGTADVYPILASAVTWGYGPTGTFGFGTTGVKDRFNRFGHSEFFSEDYVREFWLPFLDTGTILPSKIERTRSTTPYWQSVLSKLPLRWVLAGLMLFAALSPTYYLYSLWPSTGLSFAGNTAIISHVAGSPNVILPFKFSHFKLVAQTLSVNKLALFEPNGKEHYLDVEGAFFNNPAEFCTKAGIISTATTVTSVMPGEQYFTLSFLALNSGLREVMTQTHEELLKKGKQQPCRPTLDDKDWLSAETLGMFKARSTQTWIWYPGDWRFVLDYTVNGQPQTLKGRFPLTTGDIDCMKSVIEHYSSGIGLFTNWRFDVPQNVCGFVLKVFAVQN